MEDGKIFLASVRWREPNIFSDITPGKFAISDTFNPHERCFEVHVPAYAREAGKDLQLAIRSRKPCAIVSPDGTITPMANLVHPDTGTQWWVEKGAWVSRGRYHDAPSFHRPGGTVTLKIGGDICLVHLYQLSFTDAEFSLILDDLKNWCWRMAIDEACYVTVAQDGEVRVLSADYMRHAQEFIRNIESLLKAPHCELRESVALQRIEKFRPNIHSIRFLLQRGDCPHVPGRSTAEHYNTGENRFVYAMLKRVMSMLTWTAKAANDRANRFSRLAEQYAGRASQLQSRTTETVNQNVLEETIRRVRAKWGEEKALLEQGYTRLQITDKEGYNTNYRHGSYDNQWALVELGVDPDSARIRDFLERYARAVVIGRIDARQRISQNGNIYCSARVEEVVHLDVWRDYESELAMLERHRKTLQAHGWEQALPRQVILERRREAGTLFQRTNALLDAAKRTATDAASSITLLAKATSLDEKARFLGITPEMRFVPTMVFIQSPPYAGTLSAYRQLLTMTGIDEVMLDDLLGLEDVGLRDWPGVYERWCLVSILRVLQDDFRFTFDKEDVRLKLLAHCTGKKEGAFSVSAKRTDMKLSLTLSYQASLTNRRIPDFLLILRDLENNQELRCVLDAKSCDFRHRPDGAARNPWIYLDDCLDELVNVKDYSERGQNSVFVLHSVDKCHCDACIHSDFPRGPITHPTTLQHWANSSSYGGDAVFSWENVPPEHQRGAILVRPDASLPNLRRLFLMLIQFGLGRKDICASCAAGADEIEIIERPTEGGATKYECKCRICGFISIRSHCYNCRQRLFKNQAWWSYHDLHPTNVWNTKCWECGALL